ncbi:MAG: hypothetical protein LM576_09150, partial [Thermofilum sp.]|nr:hypothetical protein [Thermofilum sp.]
MERQLADSSILSQLLQYYSEIIILDWDNEYRFQFFPSCCGVPSSSGVAVFEVDFQFFPSCCGRRVVSRPTGGPRLSILSQLQQAPETETGAPPVKTFNSFP